MKQQKDKFKIARIFGFSGTAREDKLKRIILIRILLITCAAGIVWSGFYFILGLYLAGFAVAGYAVASLLNLGVFYVRKDYINFRFIQLILILLLPVATQLALGSFNAASGVMLAALLCPMGALMFHSPEIARRLFYLFCIAVVLLGLYEMFFPHLKVDVDEGVSVFFFVMNFISISAIVYFLLEYFVAQQTVFQNLLAERNKDITDSITYAQRIQNAILPPDNFFKAHLPNSFIYYKPKDIVAGDFYWMEVVGDVTIFAAADCTGHGVPGAMVSVVCVNALNRSVREFGLTNPAQILEKTRELVIGTFERSDEVVRDGMDISLCAINLKTKNIEWAGANNPIYHIKKNDEGLTEEMVSNETHYLREIKPDSQPIAKYAKENPFTNHSVNLVEGDIFILITDGFADQFGGEKGKKFKYKPFKELLLANMHLPMDEQRQALSSSFENWKGNYGQIDDICVIGVRV
ncbi:MAG: SpoIIE family protein phosphatase [Flavobacteriales bacterium]|nr:SpoIIE family protein phosphatase [Flavobacteriales bacterium]